ncbi:MAG: ferrous iron transport protein B [Lachnospiraceae bacterium]|nr:ferrous iron transport protein B [Lachnospiraceae bacterium]
MPKSENNQRNMINVAFIGNPNCGKTSLFNAFTGARLKVANWPGVTVEKKEGHTHYHDHDYKLVDLPGIYSLTSYTMEETLSREYILGDDVDVIVNVVDASSLERNLYLTLQLIELGKPVVLALNMMDIVEERGMEIDLHRLPEMLGIPAIPVSARKKTGLNILMHAVAHHKDKPVDKTEHHHSEGQHIHRHHDEYVLVYSDEIEDKIDAVKSRLKEHYPDMKNKRWHAIKMLALDDEVCKKYPVELSDIVDKNYESDIVAQKYDFIDEVMEECMVNRAEKSARTDKIDAVLTHKIWGVPAFLGIMALVFFFTFTVGDWLKGYLEIGLDWLFEAVAGFLAMCHVSDWVISLVVDGALAGVGGILSFLPNIFILFLALAILEDSGYMSRVAYVMNHIMGRLGLSGRAFIPMLLGFGCSVPAVMASRALENPKDRLRTIMVTPFMSCSARLPVYVLLSSMFFGKYAVFAAFSMYVIGMVIAVLVSVILNKIMKTDHVNNLLIELPEYKTPNVRSIWIYVWEKIKEYITKAGTTIFVASVVVWLLMNFGPHGMVEDMADSFGAYIGKLLVPIMKPTGLGYWQIVLALISGIAAKEVVVSSLSVLYGITNVSSAAGMASLVELLGTQGFTGVNAYSMMLFSLLYVPCIATIAMVRQETKSRKWTMISVCIQLGTAWLVSALFYQIALLFI